jgi:hypothetical protein
MAPMVKQVPLDSLARMASMASKVLLG